MSLLGDWFGDGSLLGNLQPITLWEMTYDEPAMYITWYRMDISMRPKSDVRVLLQDADGFHSIGRWVPEVCMFDADGYGFDRNVVAWAYIPKWIPNNAASCP